MTLEPLALTCISETCTSGACVCLCMYACVCACWCVCVCVCLCVCVLAWVAVCRGARCPRYLRVCRFCCPKGAAFMYVAPSWQVSEAHITPARVPVHVPPCVVRAQAKVRACMITHGYGSGLLSEFIWDGARFRARVASFGECALLRVQAAATTPRCCLWEPVCASGSGSGSRGRGSTAGRSLPRPHSCLPRCARWCRLCKSRVSRGLGSGGTQTVSPRLKCVRSWRSCASRTRYQLPVLRHRQTALICRFVAVEWGGSAPPRGPYCLCVCAGCVCRTRSTIRRALSAP